MNKNYFLIVLTVFFLSKSYAQTPEWKQFNCSENVNAIAVEGQVLWLGTSAGLIKYDTVTKSVTCFDNSTAHAPINRINNIAIDKFGNKWLGTFCGLVKYDNVKFDSTVTPFTNQALSALAIDKQGNIWIGLWQGGLYKFDGIKWKYVSTYSDTGFETEFVHEIVVDKDGNVWVASIKGLFKYNGTNWKCYNSKNTNLTADDINSVAVKDSNTVWLSNRYYGIAKLNTSTDSCTIYNTSNSAPFNNDIVKIRLDANGVIWCGTMGDFGLIRYDGVNFKVYSNYISGVSLNVSLAMTIDTINKVWIGCRGFYFSGGFLSSFENEKWTLHNIKTSGLPQSRIGAIAEDKDGYLWIGNTESGGTGGLSKFNKDKTWTVYDRKNAYSYLSASINCIAFDTLKTVYVGTTAGLLEFNGVKWNKYDHNNSPIPVNDHIISLVIDKQNNKWIGTWGGGLLKYDGVKWEKYDSSSVGLPVIKNGRVMDMEFDKQGNLWMISNGLTKYDGKTWTHYTKNSGGFPTMDPRSLSIDGLGNLWIGTSSEGLIKFDGTTCTSYTTSNSGLPHDMIYDLGVDSTNRVWISTANGVVNFDGANWAAPITDCNSPLSNNAIIKVFVDKDNSVWFGSREGLTRYGIQTSTEISKQDNLIKASLFIYPNPFSRATTVQFNTVLVDASICIYNAFGQIVKQVNNVSGKEINLYVDNLSSGVYFLRLTQNNKILGAEKLVLAND